MIIYGHLLRSITSECPCLCRLVCKAFRVEDSVLDYRRKECGIVSRRNRRVARDYYIIFLVKIGIYAVGLKERYAFRYIERKALNKAYYEHVWQVGAIAVVLALVEAIIAFAGVGWITFVPVISVAVTGVCVLIVAATRMNKRLWRK